MMIMTNENVIPDEKGVVPRINIPSLKNDGCLSLIIKEQLSEANIIAF